MMAMLRVIDDPPAEGGWNMAVDEALLLSAEGEGAATLRLYRWREPTLSLGYFQRAAERELHSPSRDCPLVRRHSGGGAILHDRELTYSLAMPRVGRTSHEATALFTAVHETLREILAARGVATRLWDGLPSAAPEPFLCFLRRSKGDLVCGAVKIAGSAQRRRRTALLQHGSILLDRSPCAPELPGVNALGGEPMGADWLAAQLAERLPRRLGRRAVAGTLSPAERDAAEDALRTKFAAHAWTHRR